jgi:hypothetical protein
MITILRRQSLVSHRKAQVQTQLSPPENFSVEKMALEENFST